jgi:hypothetical protein
MFFVLNGLACQRREYANHLWVEEHPSCATSVTPETRPARHELDHRTRKARLSNLNLLAKDYIAPNGKQQIHTLLPVTQSALTLHVNNIGNTGYEAMIEAVKEQARGFSDKYLDLDAMKRQVALDKLQSALQTVPRKAYTHKNNSAPMKYARMFENNGLSSYYDDNNHSPEEVECSETADNSGNGYERSRQAETIERKKVKTISTAKKSRMYNISSVRLKSGCPVYPLDN